MVKTKMLEKKNLVVEYIEEYNYLYLRWIGFQREEDIYESGEEILKIFKNMNNCHKILNDNREVRGPWNKASEWTTQVWFPSMINAGLEKFAWVFPDNVFAELSASKAMPDTELVRKFDTYQSAEEWLNEDLI